MKPLDIRDIAIIDAFPVYGDIKTVLNVGCGEGRIDFHLAELGFTVYATDIKRKKSWRKKTNLKFCQANILNPLTFPLKKASVVICSQVLEHLKNYRGALANLLNLAEIRLILTIPYRRSFNDPSHCNYWDDTGIWNYKNVHEFELLCAPYAISISKIRTKPEDAKADKCNYLIIVDKRHDFARKKK